MISSGQEGSADRLYERIFIPLNAGKIKKILKFYAIASVQQCLKIRHGLED